MKTFQDRLGAWGDRTFPHSTFTSKLSHLDDEVRELWAAPLRDRPHDAIREEAADCFMLLCHVAHAEGFDLLAAAEEKFAAIQSRTWDEPDERGVVRHVEPPVA